MRSTFRFCCLTGVVLVGLLVVLTPTPSRADDGFAGADIPDRVWVDLGAQGYEVTTRASASGKAGVGTSIDFEDIFNLPTDKTAFRLMGTVRISPHRRWIDFGYDKIDRSGGAVIQNDINFGDYTFHAGGQVNAGFNTEFIYTAFRYDFLHEDKVRISGSAGLAYTKLGVSLDGFGNVDGPSGPIAGEFESDQNVKVPVPLIGINLDWALTKRLVVRSYNRFFRIRVAGNDGGMYENGVHLNWYFVKNFGLGVGYDRLEIRGNKINLQGDATGTFDYVLSGIGLYATLAF